MEDELWELLSDPEKDAWQRLQSTLDSPGFKLIMRDLEEQHEALKNQVYHAQSWEHYHRLLGQLEGLEHLLSVEDRAIHELSQAVMDRMNVPVDPRGEENVDAFA